MFIAHNNFAYVILCKMFHNNIVFYFRLGIFVGAILGYNSCCKDYDIQSEGNFRDHS